MRTKRDGYGTGIYLLVLAFLFGGIAASHAQETKVHQATIIIWGAGEIEATVIEYPNGDVSVTSIAEPGDVVLFSFKKGLSAFGFELVKDKPNRYNIIYLNKVVGRIFFP